LGVELFNARPGQVFVLLVSASDKGSVILREPFDIGLPAYVAAVGGRVMMTGQMRVFFQIPKPLPGGSRDIFFEGMIFDPKGIPLNAVVSTNMETVFVQN